MPGILKPAGWLALAALACTPLGAVAAETDGRLWSTLQVSAPVAGDLSAALELQTRFRDDVSDLERLVVRPSITLRPRPWLAGTLGYDAHIIESPVDATEHRAWQQLAAPFELGGAALTPRVRLEERFADELSGVAVRARLGAFARLPLGSSAWSLVASEEAFVNLNSLRRGPDSGFGENRAFAGVGRDFGERVTLEVGYLNQWIERPGVPDLVNHTFAITLRAKLR